MKYLIIMLFILFGAEILAQANPTGFTTFLKLRKYASGDNPGADSLNANLDDIDAGVKKLDDTLTTVKADLYNTIDFSGNLKAATVGSSTLKTELDTSLVKTTGADIMHGSMTTKGAWTNSAAWTFNSSIDFNSNGFLRLPTNDGIALGGTMWYIDIATDLVAYSTNAVGGKDTVLSLGSARSTYFPFAGGTITGVTTFEEAITQEEVWHSGFETVTVTSATLTLNGNANNYEIVLPAGSQTVTSIPVTGKVQGDVIFLINTASSNTLTLNDSSPFNLTGSFVLGEDDNITLYYDGTLWVEKGRSDN